MTTAESLPLILVVDDDVGVARLIEKNLRRGNLDVMIAHSGAVALALLETQRPRLMLLDLKLQDLGGAELVDRLARENRSVPFIVITGQGGERAAVEMMMRGARDYLVKDAEFLQFVPEVVRRVLTELKKEERLAEAEGQARLGQMVIEQGYSAVLIITADLSDPRGVFANPAFTQLAGCAAGEVVGKTLSEIERRTGPMPELHRALETGRPFSGERLARQRGPEVRLVDCHIAPVADRIGGRSHWMVIQQDVTERYRLEDEIREVSQREQRRIGQDLHDGLGQELTAIELMCESLRTDLAKSQPTLAEQAKQICGFLRTSIERTRSLARGLAPFKVEEGGLRTALVELAAMTSVSGKVKCRVEASASVQVADEAAVHLYRIAQEAVNNAVKHSGASEIVLRLGRAKKSLRLEVTDNGSGLPPARHRRRGMGLGVMKHRSNTIGAEMEVVSRPGMGVSVVCTLPAGK